MSLARGMLLTLVASVILGALGAWAGAHYAVRQMHGATPMHQMVHDELKLSADQASRIDRMEKLHAGRRHALETEMRAANRELAQALEDGHAFTPKVQAAIDRFHMAMGALQKETIVHVLDMRSVLTPDQARRFDDRVVRSLTQDPA